MYGHVNFNVIETEPGGHGAFAPPAGFQGDQYAYKDWLLERYATDRGVSQHVTCVAKRMLRSDVDRPTFKGKFSRTAKFILTKLQL